MESYVIKNSVGNFSIIEIDGAFKVWGDRKAAAHEFKKHGRRPPDRNGGFRGRERNGSDACRWIISKYYDKDGNKRSPF